MIGHPSDVRASYRWRAKRRPPNPGANDRFDSLRSPLRGTSLSLLSISALLRLSRCLLMGAECGCRRSNKSAPAGIAPSLARWPFGGRSLGFRWSATGLLRCARRQPLQPLPSLCWFRPSAAAAAASRQTRPQTLAFRSFLPPLQGGLVALRRGWACGATRPPSAIVFEGCPPTPPLLPFSGWLAMVRALLP